MSRDVSGDSHVKAGEWPKATTPCAPSEQGNALVAYVLVAKKDENKQSKRRKQKIHTK
jgi:hypothetical protein